MTPRRSRYKPLRADPAEGMDEESSDRAREDGWPYDDDEDEGRAPARARRPSPAERRALREIGDE